MLTNRLPGVQRTVYGVTVLFDEVFVVRYMTPEVEVYDSNMLNLTRRIPIAGLVHPYDLSSCSKFRCLYIADKTGSAIHRVELGGTTTRWNMSDSPYALSVTPDPDFHIIVTCGDARKLKEFATNGTLVREILLQEDLIKPLHAIQFNGQFVISHGYTSDRLHRVCTINSTSHVTRCYGGPPGSAIGQLNQPWHLAMDEKGNVLVADYTNGRVLMLDNQLNYVGELISRPNSNMTALGPWRLCLADIRLFVNDYLSNDLFVYRVRDL